MKQAVKLLLDAESVRREGDRGKGLVVATAIGIGHLCLCGVSEPSLPRTAMDFAWREAAVFEILLWIVLSAQTFTGSVAPLILRTRLLPVAAEDRYTFTFLALSRRPPFVALLLSGTLFLGVHFRAAPATALASWALCLTSALTVQAFLAMLFLLILKTRAPMATSLVSGAVAGIAWILGASIVGTEGLLATLPIAAWWTDGVGGMLGGGIGTTVRCEGLTILAGTVSFLAGRRWT